METTDQVRHLTDQINAARSRDPANRPLVTVASRMPQPPRGRTTVEWAERITLAVRAPNLSALLITKVARALSERRIPEGDIETVLAGLDRAHNRGAYFQAAAKRIFGKYKLDWIEENWQ